jgi:DNA-binding response OmpR family regulator
MSHVADDVDGALASATHWLTVQGVAVEHWPPRDPAADHDPSRRPIVFLVQPGADPPRLVDDLATWMQLPGSVSELRERAQTVLMRARASGTVLTYVDDDGVLRVGDRMAILPRVEAEIIRVLLERVGSVVGREEINAAVWPTKPTTDNVRLNSRVKHLRDLIADLPLRIHSVRGRGLLLEIAPRSNRVTTT